MAGLTKIKSGGFAAGCALPSDATATTQSAGDNSTKIATTAYADAAGGSGDTIEVGNTKVFCTDTGSNGTVKINTEGSTRVTVDHNGFVTIPGNMSVAGMHLGLGTSSAHSSNTVFGNVAGENLESGATYNVCIGYEGGRGISTGDNNVMIGYRTGTATLTSHDNVGIGQEALQDCTGGYMNVCVGRETGQNLTTGYSNTFLGERAGYTGTVTGHSNVGIGVYAAAALTSGAENVAIGKNAGVGFTEGDFNVCLGRNAGDEITTGDSNICIGNQSAGGLTTGSNNTIIGGPSSGFGASTSDTVSIGIVGTERMRIDSSGRFLIGSTTARTDYSDQTSGLETKVQIEGTSWNTSTLSLIRNSNDNSDPEFIFAKSKGGGSNVDAVTTGTDLGSFSFQGADGTTLQQGVKITAEASANAANNDLEAHLFFSTNAGGTGVSERMRILANGNVGIGTSSPGAQLDVYASSAGTYFKGGSNHTDRQLNLISSTTTNAGDTHTIRAPSSSGNLALSTVDKEWLRLTHEGKISVGSDGGGYTVDYGGMFTVVGDDDGTYTSIGRNTDQSNQMYMRNGAGTSSFTHIGFANTGGQRGSIVTNGSSTTYNTTSDYRIKENVVTLTGAIDRVKQLAPKRFNFTGETQVFDGFLAHEAQTVVPEAVTGEKDAVDANNEPELQGIDQSKLVPLLTAALQEAIAKIETLETKVAALEAG